MIDSVGKLCTGCMTCIARCPQKAIVSRICKDGFMMPLIDHAICVDCGICDKVCPIINDANISEDNIESFAAQALNKPTESSSGGAFAAIAEYIINCGGIVYGATLKEGRHVKHIGISSIEEIRQLSGSKYVQSEITQNIPFEIESHLKSGRKVLFVGCPCQVSGLKSFLRKPYENLFLIDLICHGVPSSKLFTDYISYCEKLRGKKIIDFKFRDNREGWNNIFKSTIYYSDGKQEYNTALSNLWNRIFFSELATRPSCSQCKFSNMHRLGDLTLGDFWGINKSLVQNADKGISLILCNTAKGKALLNRSDIVLKEAETTETEHPNLFHPTKANPDSAVFLESYRTNGFKKTIKDYFGFTRWLDLKIRVHALLLRTYRR